MRKSTTLGSIALLMSVVLTACDPSKAGLDAEATRTAADTYATQTAQATAKTALPTSTPMDTPTAEPTAVPTADLIFGDYEDIEHGGFRYKMIEDFYRTYRPGAVTMSSDAPEILITFGGAPVRDDMTQKEALEDLRSFMSSEMGDFDASEIYPFSIGEVDGLAIDIAGEMFDDHMLGLIAMVYHHDGASFEVIALAPDKRWLLDGAYIVDQILQSIEFFAPTPMENYCPVSSDPTYGYSQDNPIRVGTGDVFEGPSLERAYLDQLLGPRGEEIEYVRRGSFDTGETIVDVYEITIGYLTETVVLYLDEYNLDPFVIPQGFACAWSFD